MVRCLHSCSMNLLHALDRWTFASRAIPTPGPGPLSWGQEWARGVLRDPAQLLEQATTRHCPCCGFTGSFVSAKRTGLREFRCPWCKSRPRDRYLALLLDKHIKGDLEGKRVLHFAPEWPLFNRLKKSSTYIGADILKRRNANVVMDITSITAPDGAFDVIVCNHVLEHVPDHTRAMRECARVLAPSGIAFFSFPVDMSRDQTWEPPPGMPPDEVERICGWDHKRLYGRDAAQLLRDAGFKVELEQADAAEQERHRLLAEDVFFVCR
jgi:SAM-dependent methyltransferase